MCVLSSCVFSVWTYLKEIHIYWHFKKKKTLLTADNKDKTEMRKSDIWNFIIVRSMVYTCKLVCSISQRVQFTAAYLNLQMACSPRHPHSPLMSGWWYRPHSVTELVLTRVRKKSLTFQALQQDQDGGVFLLLAFRWCLQSDALLVLLCLNSDLAVPCVAWSTPRAERWEKSVTSYGQSWGQSMACWHSERAACFLSHPSAC